MSSFVVTAGAKSASRCRAKDPNHCPYHGTVESTGAHHFATRAEADAFIESESSGRSAVRTLSRSTDREVPSRLTAPRSSAPTIEGAGPMNITFTTRNAAIQSHIIDAIDAGEASSTEYDIDAIADEVIIEYTTPQGEVRYAMNPEIDEDTFWGIVEANEQEPLTISDAWENKESLEGYDSSNGATSSIDDDQAIDDETGKAYYDKYYITVDGIRHEYSAAEMEEFSRNW